MIRSLTRALPQGNVQSLDDWVYLSTTSEPCHDMLSCRNWLARLGSLVALLLEITERCCKCIRSDNQYILGQKLEEPLSSQQFLRPSTWQLVSILTSLETETRFRSSTRRLVPSAWIRSSEELYQKPLSSQRFLRTSTWQLVSTLTSLETETSFQELIQVVEAHQKKYGTKYKERPEDVPLDLRFYCV